MKEKLKKPLEPYVTIEQMAAFRSGEPETFTGSRIIDAVCEAFETIGYSPRVSVADYLQVDAKELSGALKLICGYGLKEARVRIVRQKVKKIVVEYAWNTDQIAHHLGFADRSALFRILGEKEYDRLVAKYIHWRREKTITY